MLEALAAALKTLLYACILVYAGILIAATILRIPQSLNDFVRRTSRGAAILAVPIAVLITAVLVQRLGGFEPATYSAVFSSSTGASLFMLVSGVVLLLALGDDESSKGVRLIAAALATGSLAFSSHAATAGPFEAMFHFVHVSAAAWWIGSLLILRESCNLSDRTQVAAVLARFTQHATAIVGGLVVAGFLLIYVLVEFESLPKLSDYEINLLIKLDLVVVPFAIAAFNKFRLTPKIFRANHDAIQSLRKMISIELAAIGCVLVATAVLTTLTSPH